MKFQLSFPCHGKIFIKVFTNLVVTVNTTINFVKNGYVENDSPCLVLLYIKIKGDTRIDKQKFLI